MTYELPPGSIPSAEFDEEDTKTRQRQKRQVCIQEMLFKATGVLSNKLMPRALAFGPLIHHCIPIMWRTTGVMTRIYNTSRSRVP